MLLAQADTALDAADTIGQTLTPEEIKAAAGVATGAGLLFGGMAIVWVIVGLVGLVFLIWWIVLLIDLLNRDFEQKNTYLIVMIAGLVLGFVWLVDLIYYFGIVKKSVGTKKS